MLDKVEQSDFGIRLDYGREGTRLSYGSGLKSIGRPGPQLDLERLAALIERDVRVR